MKWTNLWMVEITRLCESHGKQLTSFSDYTVFWAQYSVYMYFKQCDCCLRRDRCSYLHEVWSHKMERTATLCFVTCREQVKVNGFGIFILGLYPGAFVELFTEQLQVISPMRQLRIYCAGVWHNFIIVVLAMLTLLVLPWLLMPFYTVGQAIVVTGVVEVRHWNEKVTLYVWPLSFK